MRNTEVLQRVLLNIDQVSRITGVKKTTLRYWEKEFADYLQPQRTPTNRRQYTMDDVHRVENLRHLIEVEKYKSVGVKMKLGLDT
ncbi:MAG: MerR family transcriptional regulator [Thermodesulfobacteriota bacterium]